MSDRSEPALRVAARVALTSAEGPGRRFAVWVQGCGLRCPKCCNPRMFSSVGGSLVPIAVLASELERAHSQHSLEGITVLGGEPLEQIPAVTALCRRASHWGLGVLIFSGYRLAQAERLSGFESLWATVDTLIDGRYDATQPEPQPEHGGRRFIGSRNQTLCHRTDRYRSSTHWTGAPRVEVHLDANGALQAHGHPTTVEELLIRLDPPVNR